MIFVIPASGADFDKLPKFIKVLQHFGGLRRHSAIVVPTQAVEPGTTPLLRPLYDLFGKVEVVPVQTPDAGAWPWPSNQHFQSAYTTLQHSLEGPWMWLELDSCPLVSTWADDLHSQKEACGKPFMGVVRNTDEVNPSLDGQHMVGFGIYPPDISKYTNLWNFPPKDIPFDVFMRYDVTKHAHNTNLIAHFWGSRSYQSDLTGLDHNGNQVLIPKSAVIVHGVKDDSLYDIILGEKIDLPAIDQAKAAKEEVVQEFAYSLDEMAEILRKAGYFVATPEAVAPIMESEELVPQPTEPISTQSDDLQGDPAMGDSSSRPVETKADVEPNTATKVQLPKRGRPRKIV